MLLFLAATALAQLLLHWLVGSGPADAAAGSARPRRRLPPLGRSAVRLRLEHWQTASRLSSTFSCVSMDWWPSQKCDYGTCPWSNSSVLSADLDDPLLLAAMRALAPIHLRVGGSLADQVIYEGVEGAPACQDLAVDATRRIGFRGGCLPLARWLRLLDFCKAAGCGVIFSANALHGRTRAACDPAGTPCRLLKRGARPACCTSYTGGWDASNLGALLRATASAGKRPAGLAFGNELAGRLGIEAHLPPDECVARPSRPGPPLHTPVHSFTGASRGSAPTPSPLPGPTLAPSISNLHTDPPLASTTRRGQAVGGRCAARLNRAGQRGNGRVWKTARPRAIGRRSLAHVSIYVSI